MSEDFIRHEPCPRCHSRDNLGVWGDHKWCFGCGYREGDDDSSLDQIRRLQVKHNPDNKKRGNSDVFLPTDVCSTLRLDSRTWLDKYGITEKERIVNHLQWSDSYERLYFPVYDLYGNLVVCQGRYFGTGSAPRYLTKGQTDSCYHVLGEPSSTICLVEDCVSAIKVARQFQVMPLWGSQISTERLITLSDRFSNLVVWLDRDKADYALKAQIRASVWFDKANAVITEKDPKDYEDKHIRECLRLHY